MRVDVKLRYCFPVIHMKHRLFLLLLFLSLGSILGCGNSKKILANKPQKVIECDKLGWFPEDFGLKDHSVFVYDGYYYLISIYVPPGTSDPLAQDRFAYARSTDFCTWEQLGFVLENRTGTWDEASIWAPYVFEEDGTFYLFYTGVTQDVTQSILLATSVDPADPLSWQTEDMIFQPDHSGTNWIENDWADCRDPMVIKKNDMYYLYYTGKDQAGGIIGVAESPSLMGTWDDQGSVIEPDPTTMPESPFVLFQDGEYYLFYNLSTIGEYYQTGTSHLGPWSEEISLPPGWANEFFPGMDGKIYSSYLTDFSVSISPVSWDRLFSPPRPVLSEIIYYHFLPQINNPNQNGNDQDSHFK